MSYGYFDGSNLEYVITDPRTPVKWINYIGTRQFGGFVDHTGGALICKEDPTYNRITRYIQQLPSSDFKGETLYMRLHTTEGYRVFSPFFVPTLDVLDRFECHIGLGYTRIISEYLGILTDTYIFVPKHESVEIRDIRITNTSAVAVNLDAVPVVEYSHPNALMQFTNADWIPQTMQSRAIMDGEYTILLQYPFMCRDSKVNYFTSNAIAQSFETDRKIFLGHNEYGSYRSPLSLFRNELHNSQAQRGDNIAALLHECGSIEAAQTYRLITQLGQVGQIENAMACIEKYRVPGNVDAALAEIADFWQRYLEAIQVYTPDDKMNVMLNLYNPYQCYVTKTWSRYLSYYQPGLGSRGIGFRDSAQDVIAVCASVPEEVKDLTSVLMSFQKADGSAVHQFNPLTMEGGTGDSSEMSDRPQFYSDDHLWSILAVTAYLKESGDMDFLDENIPFYTQGKAGFEKESAVVIEHLRRAIEFTRKNTGRHGLPLLGFADWNDTVNLPCGAESMFTANLYGKALLEMIDLCDYLGDSDTASCYRNYYEEMRNRFEAAAWDGAWYMRYFDAEANPLGSSSNQHGQIYLNAQSWAVLSGFASGKCAHKAMEAVYSKLNTKFGIKLSSPGFNGYDAKYGGVTTYPPGAKENGGIFLHPNPWAMIAETILGNGDRAYEYYAQINPIAKNESIDQYECKPYVYAQNILGDEHKQFGLARNSWLSGTASWCYQAATQWILGIRPEYQGLRVDPCIPSSWKGFSIRRIFRGKKFDITVYNPQSVCKGVVQMRLDGENMDGNLIRHDLSGVEHHIEVCLGRT